MLHPFEDICENYPKKLAFWKVGKTTSSSQSLRRSMAPILPILGTFFDHWNPFLAIRFLAISPIWKLSDKFTRLHPRWACARLHRHSTFFQRWERVLGAALWICDTYGFIAHHLWKTVECQRSLYREGKVHHCHALHSPIRSHLWKEAGGGGE